MRPFSQGVPTLEPLRRILVVDDESRILDFVSRGLQREEFAVDVATDGRDGLDRALAESYDLVILDLLMPGLDGVSVLRGILASKPDQPVIVLSALTGAAVLLLVRWQEAQREASRREREARERRHAELLRQASR